jgi:hypothetical protein
MKVNDIANNPQLGPQLPSALLAGNAPSPQNWMAQMPDTRKLSELNLPGTHETCARLPQYINGSYNINWLRTMRSIVRTRRSRSSVTAAFATTSGADTFKTFSPYITECTTWGSISDRGEVDPECETAGDAC